MKLKSILSIGASMIASSSLAATVAIIDSGVDYQHKNISNQIWINLNETANDQIDNDGNGFVDDVYGWNFGDKNNQIIDYKYQESVTEDVLKFFDIQSKALNGTASQEEITWMQEMVNNEDFVSNLMIFGNYSHGTHVAGISVGIDSSNKIIGIKLLPTENPAAGNVPGEGDNEGKEEVDSINPIMKGLINLGLGQVAKQQSKMLADVGTYVNSLNADVANCSFGTSVNAIKPVVKNLISSVLKDKVPSDRLTTEFATNLVNNMVDKSKTLIDSSKNTLFVFAAGNDGMNNSESPVSPANVRGDNAISVGAVYQNGQIAPFSNFSSSMVDVAAPGVSVNSAIPGDYEMAMSGTSQAAPFVAGVAASIKNANPSLSPLEIKRIIINTVDSVVALKDKVVSGGVVNAERALYAAIESNEISLEDAIIKANEVVVDSIEQSQNQQKMLSDDVFVLPLPSLVK